jgi:hypothetical protein
MGCRSLRKVPFKVLFVLTVTFVVSFPVLFVQPSVAQSSDNYYSQSFEWDYDGRHWTWSLDIPKVLYDAYRGVPVSTRTRYGPEGYGFLTTTKDYYIRSVAESLNQSANNMGYGSFEKISFVLAFVQSLPYTSDNVTTGHDEYPRFPVETLVDDGGDCEDTSILFSTLTQILGYGTIYINPPRHFAVGVLGDDLAGTYWTYHNKTYYYCETTGDGFKIGDLPAEYEGVTAYMYSMSERAQFVPDVEIPVTPEPTLTPTPTPAPSSTEDPAITQWPTFQPNNPPSSNADLIFYVLIVLIILVPIIVGVTAVSLNRKRNKLLETPIGNVPPPPPEPPTVNFTADKFCSYCGARNRAATVFCEQCGKQIG